MNETQFSRDNRWLLPEGVDEVLPPDAGRLEALRRDVLDTYRQWGYELVIPPVIEYLESLLTGTGHDLDLQTFKLTDQLTGRLMGVRADITTQAARIDAHRLRREEPVRLCYIGTVLQTRPEGLGRSRNPEQVGAELYGHGGVESDIEIITLMMETLARAGVDNPYLDLGHVGIFRGLAEAAGLGGEAENRLFDALQRKASGEITELLDHYGVRGRLREQLEALSRLNGAVDVLDQAGELLSDAPESVRDALQSLWRIASSLERRLPNIPLHFDLGELRGYGYQTGMVFAAFAPGHGQEVARGGRYDQIGRVFGSLRPATGFSADLKTLMALGNVPEEEAAGGVFAPWSDDPDLLKTIRLLRQDGRRVICGLPGQKGDARAMGCDSELRETKGGWVVKPL